MKQPAARRPIKYLHPSAFLLAAQFLLLILYAVVDDLHSARVLLSVFGSAVLVLLVWVVKRSPAVDWVAWILAVPAITLTILTAFIGNSTLMVWSSLLEATLYFYAAASLIAYMMEDYQVTTDELFAAGATFTLFAWGFAYLSLIVQTLAPGSFIGGPSAGPTLNFIELLFLSFTNLTATGLSDIVPGTTPARVLMILEQFTGVAYITVVISRLVSLSISRSKGKR